MKKRIGILGLGGVGGFVGGQLAMAYKDSPLVQIVFIPRPNKVELLRRNGIKLLIDDDERTAYADMVSSDAGEIGQLDVLICSTKSYDLETALAPYADAIHSGTLILPLLNGVDATERIRQMFPIAQVADACIYIVSRIAEPGVIRVGGLSHSLHFGSGTIDRARLEELLRIFREAGINAILEDDIQAAVWEKFLFISVVASLTCYLDAPMGKIVAEKEHKAMLLEMLKEFLSVAKAHGISFREDILEKTVRKIENLPYETTSSMYNDYKKGGPTEYLSLTAFIADLGKRYEIKTPIYEQVLSRLAR